MNRRYFYLSVAFVSVFIFLGFVSAGAFTIGTTTCGDGVLSDFEFCDHGLGYSDNPDYCSDAKFCLEHSRLFGQVLDYGGDISFGDEDNPIYGISYNSPSLCCINEDEFGNVENKTLILNKPSGHPFDDLVHGDSLGSIRKNVLGLPEPSWSKQLSDFDVGLVTRTCNLIEGLCAEPFSKIGYVPSCNKECFLNGEFFTSYYLNPLSSEVCSVVIHQHIISETSTPIGAFYEGKGGCPFNDEPDLNVFSGEFLFPGASGVNGYSCDYTLSNLSSELESVLIKNIEFSLINPVSLNSDSEINFKLGSANDFMIGINEEKIDFEDITSIGFSVNDVYNSDLEVSNLKYIEKDSVYSYYSFADTYSLLSEFSKLDSSVFYNPSLKFDISITTKDGSSFSGEYDVLNDLDRDFFLPGNEDKDYTIKLKYNNREYSVCLPGGDCNNLPFSDSYYESVYSCENGLKLLLNTKMSDSQARKDICFNDNNNDGVGDYAHCGFCINPDQTEVVDNVDNDCRGSCQGASSKNCFVPITNYVGDGANDLIVNESSEDDSCASVVNAWGVEDNFCQMVDNNIEIDGSVCEGYKRAVKGTSAVVEPNWFGSDMFYSLIPGGNGNNVLCGRFDLIGNDANGKTPLLKEKFVVDEEGFSKQRSTSDLPVSFIDSFWGECDFDVFYQRFNNDIPKGFEWEDICVLKDKCADGVDNDGEESLNKIAPYGDYLAKLQNLKVTDAKGNVQTSALDDKTDFFMMLVDGEDPSCKWENSPSLLEDKKQVLPDYSSALQKINSYKNKPYCYDEDGDGFCGCPDSQIQTVKSPVYSFLSEAESAFNSAYPQDHKDLLQDSEFMNYKYFCDNWDKTAWPYYAGTNCYYELYYCRDENAFVNGYNLPSKLQFPDCVDSPEVVSFYDGDAVKIEEYFNWQMSEVGKDVSGENIHPLTYVPSGFARYSYYDFNCNGAGVSGYDYSALKSGKTVFDWNSLTGIEYGKDSAWSKDIISDAITARDPKLFGRLSSGLAVAGLGLLVVGVVFPPAGGILIAGGIMDIASLTLVGLEVAPNIYQNYLLTGRVRVSGEYKTDLLFASLDVFDLFVTVNQLGKFSHMLIPSSGLDDVADASRKTGHNLDNSLVERNLAKTGTSAPDTHGPVPTTADVPTQTARVTPTAGCFLENTSVFLSNGTTKFIENIEVGDKVVAFDLENNRAVNASITTTFVRNETQYLVIEYD